MRTGVRFGEKHSLDDWNLIFATKTISAATPQTKLVEVPGRNGSIDMTETLTGNVKYNDRMLSVTFYTTKDVSHYQAIMSEIQNYLQGQRMRIIFDDDLAFYWLGRPTLDEMECDGTIGKIVISAVVEPYKYTVQSSAEDWLWDPFDFEQGVINEFAEMEVNGSLEVDVLGVHKYTSPIVISDSNMTVTFDGKTYNVVPGSQVMYNIIMSENKHKMTFNGTGKVTVNVVGGSL